jgi:hypothetical protein
LSQRAILPSVIVGDSAGISTSVAMAYRSLPPSELPIAARDLGCRSGLAK